MRSVLLICCLLVICNISSSLAEPCFESESGRNGECLPLKKCPEKLKHYREWKKVPQICDATKRTICCPEVFERTSTTKMRPPERVSGKKCKDYGKFIFPQSNFTNSHGQMVSQTYVECGHVVHELYYDNIANIKEFPHMALIGYGIEEDNQKFTCAGTLLSDQWVISGVYCANDKVLGDARHIQLGGIQRLEIEPSARLFTITQIVKHPLYTPLNMEHDIILLKMNEPAILNLYILPICLPQTETLPERAGIATGWRKTGLRDELSSVLLKINVNYYPITTCQDYDTSERSAHVDYKGMICAGANNTCQNDPGSPIQYCNEDVYCTYTITGVIARTTCNKEGATIYTNVFEYLDWIENVVWPNGI